MFQRKMAVRMGQSELGNMDGGLTMIQDQRFVFLPNQKFCFQNEVG